MPTFITIGYGDREGYDRTDAAVRDAAHTMMRGCLKPASSWVLRVGLCRCEIPTRRVLRRRLALLCPVRCP